MKILMINVVCGIRSTGRICTDLAVSLESLGHEVKIAYGRENVPEQFQKYAIRIGSELDVNLHGLKARLFDGAGFGSIFATRKFIRWVEKYDPDVIHLHNIHGYYINVKILFDYLKQSKKRVIWTLHDCWSFTGHTPYCDSVNCKRWISGCYKCPLVKEYPSSLFDRSYHNWKKKKKVFTGVDNLTIITPSTWLCQCVKKSFLNVYPIEVINNGIDTKQFTARKSNFKKKFKIEEKFILLGVSTSWDNMKGYSDFLKLAELLGDEYKVVIVGLTKEQLSKIPRNILGIERTSSVKELAEIYTASDLFLNLSYCENYPTVNIEAMACGTQVLTYDTGGSPEIVENYNGIIVEQGNISAVVNAIKSINKNTCKRINIDKSKFDNSHVISNYIKLYKR